MTIREHISGSLSGYDFTTGTWTKSTVILSDSNVISAQIDRQCSADSEPEIGGVYAASMRLTVRLSTGWNTYNLRGCRVVLRHEVNGEDLPLGVFWVTKAAKKGGFNSLIFDLEGLDAVGWLDGSSYNIDLSSRGFSKQITVGAWAALLNSDLKSIEYISRGGQYANGWLPVFADLTNQIIHDTCGVNQAISWHLWDFSVNGEYINAYIWNAENEGQGAPNYTLLQFDMPMHDEDGVIHLDNGCDKLDSTTPRDIFSQFAALSGGFIYAREDGGLALGQYMMAEYPAITTIQEIAEADSFDYAEYIIRISSVLVRAESAKDGSTQWQMTEYSGRDYYDNNAEYVYINWEIDSSIAVNDILLGGVLHDGEWLSAPIWEAFYDGYYDKGTQTDRKWHAAPTFRPFSARIFPRNSAEIPHLGCAVLLDRRGDYEVWSTVTHIKWDLHGGYVIKCAGADCRTMAQCTARSGAERTRQSTTTWLRAIGG